MYASGPEHNDESGDSRYRMLLVRPNLVLPVEREVEDDGHGNGDRETRESGRSAAYVNNGEGPWVGRAGITNIRDLTSHFLHVALDKVGRWWYPDLRSYDNRSTYTSWQM